MMWDLSIRSGNLDLMVSLGSRQSYVLKVEHRCGRTWSFHSPDTRCAALGKDHLLCIDKAPVYDSVSGSRSMEAAASSLSAES